MHIVDLTQQRKTTKAFDPACQLSQEQVDAVCALLRMSPSSTNAQPWHFFLASSEAAKAKVAAGTSGDFAYNEPKIKNAALVVVMCARTRMDEVYLQQVLDQETKDGRLATEDARLNQHKVRSGYVQKHEQSAVGLLQWSARQVYIALGFLLLGAAEMGIDACPIEGFDAAAMDQALDLEAQGLASQVIVALGRKSEQDFNAGLPKSRLPESAVITKL
ncbi:MAG: oxygen-insensitive NAD(P)H-dependent nitroreductase NfsB [Pseudomonadota bacterium]|jgi:nitroreductase/dihydropteridine reductase